jgi:DNA-directed RNA polymerase subunit RPC12/RpoP
LPEPSDDTLGIQCPQCGKQLRAGGSLSGKRVKCPSCGTRFMVPGPDNLAEKSPVDPDDWLSLDAPAISDIDRRQQESAAIKAQRDAAAKNRQAQLSPRKSDSRTANQPTRGTPPTTDGRHSGEQPDGDDDFRLAPLERNAPPKPFAQPTGTKPSIFDDDLPELAEITGQAPVRPSVKRLLEIEAEDVEGRPHGKSAPPNREGKTTPRRVSQNPAQPVGKTVRPSLDAVDETAADYRVTCSVCGTAQYVARSAQGMKIKCPDCHSSFRAPPPREEKKSKPRIELSDEELPLAPTQDHWQKAEADSQRSRTTAMLERAKRELTEDEVERLYDEDFDTAGFVQRSMGLLFDPVAVGLMLGYGAVFAIVFAAVQFGLMNSENGFGRGALLIGFVVAPLAGVLFGMPMLSSALALLESVANRQPQVKEWPGFNVFDHFGDMLAIAAALLLSSLPGGLLGLFVFSEGDFADRMRLIMAMISIYALFPIILLSILDNGSLTQPISESVLRSIRPAAEAWGAYYLKTFILFATAALAWLLLLGPTNHPAIVAIAGFLLSPLVFFTFQQLGALADGISEHLSFEFTPSDSQKSDADKLPSKD